MNNNINANHKLNALPPPLTGKGQGVKKKSKPSAAANAGIKFETDSYVQSEGDRYIPDAYDNKPAADKFSGEGLIILEDILAFVEAYNKLPDALGEDFHSVRVEMYKPVRLKGQSRHISLYEIGIAHSPDSRQMGMLSIDRARLTEALKNRAADVHALFLQEEYGLLRRLSLLVPEKENTEPFLRVCAKIHLRRIRGARLEQIT